MKTKVKTDGRRREEKNIPCPAKLQMDEREWIDTIGSLKLERWK